MATKTKTKMKRGGPLAAFDFRPDTKRGKVLKRLAGRVGRPVPIGDLKKVAGGVGPAVFAITMVNRTAKKDRVPYRIERKGRGSEAQFTLLRA